MTLQTPTCSCELLELRWSGPSGSTSAARKKLLGRARHPGGKPAGFTSGEALRPRAERLRLRPAGFKPAGGATPPSLTAGELDLVDPHVVRSALIVDLPLNAVNLR